MVDGANGGSGGPSPEPVTPGPDSVQQHRHADSLADFPVAVQASSQGGGIFPRSDRVDGHTCERRQHDGSAG